jgi:mono/diheme cytochrome c family protein
MMVNQGRLWNVYVASVLVLAGAPVVPALEQDQRSIRDGVYTQSQAARGRQGFQQICTACHTVADHTGKRFATKWSDTTLGDLYDVISNTMPEGNPGSLEPTEYVAIIAFILKESGYREGQDELPADSSVLKTIRIEPVLP